MTQIVDFKSVFSAELAAIRDRHNRTSRAQIPANDTGTPSTSRELAGLTCSGGGIRSASFCLGVMQGLQSKQTLEQIDYLSTVSGGGYIGTTLTIGMSSYGVFPFGRLDQENRETPEVRHLRDNSRYLIQNGLPSVITAVAIYLRGIMMNILVILPILFCAAALLVCLNPDTRELVSNRIPGLDLTGAFGNALMPFSILALLIIAALLIVYAVAVSVLPIAALGVRQAAAKVAGLIFVAALLTIFIEIHTTLLRLAFESQHLIKTAGRTDPDDVKFVDYMFDNAKAFVIYISPVVLFVLPYLKTLISKATTAETTSWGGLIRKLASRLILLFAAAIVPLLLWLSIMQLAYWGTQLSQCPGSDQLLGCPRQEIVDGGWTHAPALLQWYFAKTALYRGAFVSLVIAALALFCFWPFLSVNSNSLHQLYRDRLGSAFLIKRKDPTAFDDQISPQDAFRLSDIEPANAPYHLINTALNVPGSRFANRRGRNADFFLFSHGHIGSEATGYVDTRSAEQIVDGLNIGTAMAISGAAAAPNMGMASIRPLSPTIALLNVRLGRWVRHPRDIAHRATKLAKKAAAAGATGPESPGETQLRRFPGPRHLLYEAFSKTGVSVQRLDAETLHEKSGFVFLTDGGHIDNLGVYELLRRRCKLIIVIDGEADPDFHSGSLVQVERFARIDLNVIVRMNWEPIGARTRAVADELKTDKLAIKAGPHVALGSISYPPLTADGNREKGALLYIKASLSGDESDYVLAYKSANSAFPHETTLEQLFSEEQFEAYRALGEHIARRFLDGRDSVAVYADEKDELLAIVRAMLPAATPT